MSFVSVLMAESEDDAKRWVEEIAHYDISEQGRPDRRLHPTCQCRDGIWSVMVTEAEEADALSIIEDACIEGITMGELADGEVAE